MADGGLGAASGQTLYHTVAAKLAQKANIGF